MNRVGGESFAGRPRSQTAKTPAEHANKKAGLFSETSDCALAAIAAMPGTPTDPSP